MEPKEARDLHNKLTSDLDNHVGGYERSTYKNLVTRMKANLSQKEKKEAEDIMDILECFQRNGTIRVGNYDYLKKVFADVDKEVITKIIEPIEKDINIILAEEETMSKSKADKAAPSIPKETHSQLIPEESIGDVKPKDKASQLASNTDDLKTPSINTYEMKQNQKGFLLILNVISTERQGSETDVNNLKEFFERRLGFTVRIERDMTLNNVHSTLDRAKNTLEGIDSNTYYCFICVVMSHGDTQGILTTDDKYITMDSIVNKFKNTALKEFIGKPKIFLVQACRGGDDKQLVMHKTDNELERDLRLVTALKDADILIGYATTDGYVSYRNSANGSWFIKTLLQVFTQLYTNHHFEEMLVSVRYKFAWDDDHRSTKDDDSKQIICQMPCTWTTLTKLFYLKAAIGK